MVSAERARGSAGRSCRPVFHGTMWWTLVKVTLVQPGNRHWRSRRITSRPWAPPEGKRLARPSYMVWPSASSTATTTAASQAMRWTVSWIRPWCSSSAASSLGSPSSFTRFSRGTWTTNRTDRVGGNRLQGQSQSQSQCQGLGPRGRKEPIAAALVHGDLVLIGGRLGPGVDTGFGLGVGLFGQLHRHGAVVIVEAQVAAVVLGTRGGNRSGTGGSGAECGPPRPAHGH